MIKALMSTLFFKCLAWAELFSGMTPFLFSDNNGPGGTFCSLIIADEPNGLEDINCSHAVNFNSLVQGRVFRL